MPVFNDFNHYYVGSGHSNYSTPSYGGFSSTPSSSLGLSSPYSSRAHYLPTNYHSPNILSSIAASGFTSRYKNTNYGYKGRAQYSENRINAFSPSPYTTYSLWKENQMAAKYRSDHYNRRYNNQLQREPQRYKDSPKIDISRQRQVNETPPQYTILPVEKPITRDEQGTIKRGRTVVRMHTVRLKENPRLIKKEEVEETEPETLMESRLNRLSPIRISRLKKRSVFNYKHNDSGSKNWLDSDDSDSEGSVERKSTVRKKKTVKRNEDPKKTDRRLSTEMYEEQLAILDNMIKEELAREDADDYFSDPKRGTVKIRRSHSTDSNTDEDELKRRVGGKVDTTPSSSRRNSLFQDLIIGETISETFIEDLENKIQNNYTNVDKVFPKIKVGSVKISQKVAKKSRFDKSTIVEVDENRPKTPKFFIDDIKIESSQFCFNPDEIETFNSEDKEIPMNEAVTNLGATSVPETLFVEKVSASNVKGKPTTEKVETNELKTHATSTSSTWIKTNEDKTKVSQLETGKSELVSKKDNKATENQKIPALGKANVRKLEMVAPEGNIEIEQITGKLEDKSKAQGEIPGKLRELSKGNDTPKTKSLGMTSDEPTKFFETRGNKNEIPGNENGNESILNDTNIKAVKITSSIEAKKDTSPKPAKLIETEKIKSQLPGKLKASESNKKEDNIQATSANSNEIKKDKSPTPVKSVETEKTVNKAPVKVKDSESIKKEDRVQDITAAPTSTEIKKDASPKPAKLVETEKTELPGKLKESESDKQKQKIQDTKTPSNATELKKDASPKPEKLVKTEKTDLPGKLKESESEKKKQKIQDTKIPSNSTELKKDASPKPVKLVETEKPEIPGKVKDSGSNEQKPKIQDTKTPPNSTELKKDAIPKPVKLVETEKPEIPGKVKDSGSNEQKPKIQDTKTTQNSSVIKKDITPKPVKAETEKPLNELPGKPKESSKKANLSEVNKETDSVKQQKDIQTEPENEPEDADHPKSKKPTKSKPVKKSSRKPIGQIVHMKPRAMTIRTVQNRLPSLKTPRLAALPQPTQAVLIAVDSESEEEEDESEEESSTEVEDSSDESSEDSSDSKQGKQRKSTSSLDSGFGSACYKTRKGILLELGISQ